MMYFDTIGKMEKQKTIADLQPGESGWVPPWFLTYDDDGYVNGFDEAYGGINAPVDDDGGGTCEVKITLRSEGDYLFDLTQVKRYRNIPRKNRMLP